MVEGNAETGGLVVADKSARCFFGSPTDVIRPPSLCPGSVF